MNFKLEKAAIEQKSVLRNLLELYEYDFTEFEPNDVNEHGLFEYKYLDHYWTEEGRHPFLIKVNEKLAGFVLVRKVGVNEGNNNIYSIAEFFVMKKYRRQGVGKRAAVEVFDFLKGEWEVGQLERNLHAQKFWRNTIAEYTKGHYEEIRHAHWDGPMQRFKNL